MNQQLVDFVNRIRKTPKYRILDEASTKQAIILPFLRLLGWDVDDIDEVCPEYSVEGQRVDFSLRLNNINKFFIEVKKTSEELSKHEGQLLEYSFRQGVQLATLTNGITWFFYLPTLEGDWHSRRFYTIDILEQDPEEIANKFVLLLSKSNVSNSQAFNHAESIYKGRLRDTSIKKAIPEAWNKIISEPDSLLVEILIDSTARICGHRPSEDNIKDFFSDVRSISSQSPSISISTKLPDNATYHFSNENRIPTPEMTVSQQELGNRIIEILKQKGGTARKEDVEKEIFAIYKDVFEQPYYKELVSYGVPRWQHNIAWAKEALKHRGLIEPPRESGRGIWKIKCEMSR